MSESGQAAPATALAPRLHLAPGASPGEIEIAPAPSPDGSRSFEIRARGAVLGAVAFAPASPADVEVFLGKGGLSVVVTSAGGVRYIVLPGAQAEVQGARVALRGPELTPSPRGEAPAPALPQAVTRQAAVMGAGLATRFEPVSGPVTGCSKPGVPLVGSRSVLRCLVDALGAHGIERIFINTYHEREGLKRGLRGAAAAIEYLDEPRPSGTAGSVRKALQGQAFPGFDPGSPLLIVQGDAVTDASFSALILAHARRGAALTIGAQTVRDEDVEKFGILRTEGGDGSPGRITQLLEKPRREDAGQDRLASTGIYVLGPAVYPLILDAYERKLTEAQARAAAHGEPAPEEAELDFAREVFPRVLAEAASGAIPHAFAELLPGYWSDIGTPLHYLQAVRDVFAGSVRLQGAEALPEGQLEDGVVYWPGALPLARAEGARLAGNLIVAAASGRTGAPDAAPLRTGNA